MTQHLVPLDALVSHLLASKRSLSSISTVWRANEIVTSARSALEESVILASKTIYLRDGITEQVKVLRMVRGGIENVYKDGQREFENVIKSLDDANSRLVSTMDVLRSTIIEAAFRPAEENPRSLLDFVDEQGVETVRNTIKESIRQSKESQTEFDTSLLSFDDSLRDLKDAMASASKLLPLQPQPSLTSTPILDGLHALETHAQDMASLLDSLVSHFDLCVNAIRHTEGGFAAVRKAASSLPPGAEPVSVSGVMDSSQNLDDEGPLSEEERKEMLTVLENDAAQVEDVVTELREHLNEMEIKHDAILAHVSNLAAAYDSTAAAFSALQLLSAQLPEYLMAASDFRFRWEDTKSQIREQLQEMESMRLFYENYHTSYDNLIIEVYRRRQSEDKVKTIMRKAMEQMEKVIEIDMKERAAFRGDVGDFLPGDLWNGVTEAAPRWEFTLLSNDHGNESNEAPLLDRAVVEGAVRRDRERQRLQR